MLNILSQVAIVDEEARRVRRDCCRTHKFEQKICSADERPVDLPINRSDMCNVF
jgi:hypothetical protein